MTMWVWYRASPCMEMKALKAIYGNVGVALSLYMEVFKSEVKIFAIRDNIMEMRFCFSLFTDFVCHKLINYIKQ